MAPSEIIIDPEGDLWISTQRLNHPGKTKDKKQATDGVGATAGKDTKSDKINIKVSSKVLTLASPVFTILLTGWGKEAADFAAKKTSSETYTIDLPEDDADAASLLFQILHLKPTAPSDRPSPSSLEQLAFISDKYQCFGALRYCGAIWIRDWLPDHTQFYKLFYPSCDEVQYIDDLKRMLVFAYIVDLPKEFKSLSWCLFLTHDRPLSVKVEGGSISLVDHPLLRHDVTGKHPTPQVVLIDT